MTDTKADWEELQLVLYRRRNPGLSIMNSASNRRRMNFRLLSLLMYRANLCTGSCTLPTDSFKRKTYQNLVLYFQRQPQRSHSSTAGQREVDTSVPPLSAMAKLFQKSNVPLPQLSSSFTTFGISWSWNRGASIASFVEEPKSSNLHSIYSTPDVMCDPAAPPVARQKELSGM